MELGLTNEQKIQSLDGLKTRMNTELYSVLVTVGIDPDAFNAETWTAPQVASPGAGKYSRLIEILETLDLLNAKIAELS
jgi:hypothetical protein